MKQELNALGTTARATTRQPTAPPTTARTAPSGAILGLLPIGLLAGAWWGLSLLPLDAQEWLMLRLMLGALLLAAGLILSVGHLDRLAPRRTEVVRRTLPHHH